MNNVHYDLKNIVSKIEEASGSKAKLDEKFELEYVIGNVTEEMLLEVGFEFKETSADEKYNIYTMGNIVAITDDVLVNVSEIICD